MCESLEQVSERQWRRQHSVSVPGYPHCLRLIQGQIYQCHYEGITVYTADLKVVRNILMGEMGLVNDVAAAPGGELVVGADNGLYHVTASGERPLCLDQMVWVLTGARCVGDISHLLRYRWNLFLKSEIGVHVFYFSCICTMTRKPQV